MLPGYCVYILTNERRTVLYTGSTVDMSERLRLHRIGFFLKSFTKRYNVHKLVYFKIFATLSEAREMEYKIKGWVRSKKIVLVNSVNPEWRDLSHDR